MLLLLIAVPVIVLVAFSHNLLQAYAPSNILIRHVGASRPTLRMAGALGVLACACAAAAHTLSLAIEAGAPSWLNFLVLFLAWDAIKVGVLAVFVGARGISRRARSLVLNAVGKCSSGVRAHFARRSRSSGPAQMRRSGLADFRATGTRKTTEDAW